MRLAHPQPAGRFQTRHAFFSQRDQRGNEGLSGSLFQRQRVRL